MALSGKNCRLNLLFLATCFQILNVNEAKIYKYFSDLSDTQMSPQERKAESRIQNLENDGKFTVPIQHFFPVKEVSNKKQASVSGNGIARGSSSRQAGLPVERYMQVKHGVFHGNTPVFVNSVEESKLPEDNQMQEKEDATQGTSVVKKKDNALINGQKATKSWPEAHLARRQSTVVPLRQSEVIPKAPGTTKTTGQEVIPRTGQEARGRGKTKSVPSVQPGSAKESSQEKYFKKLNDKHGQKYPHHSYRSEEPTKRPEANSKVSSTPHHSEVTTRTPISKHTQDHYDHAPHSKTIPEARFVSKTHTEAPLMVPSTQEFSHAHSPSAKPSNSADSKGGAIGSPDTSYLVFRVPLHQHPPGKHSGKSGIAVLTTKAEAPAAPVQVPTSKQQSKTASPSPSKRVSTQTPKAVTTTKSGGQVAPSRNKTLTKSPNVHTAEPTEAVEEYFIDEEPKSAFKFFDKLSVTSFRESSHSRTYLAKTSTQLPRRRKVALKRKEPTTTTTTTVAPSVKTKTAILKLKKESKLPVIITRKPHKFKGQSGSKQQKCLNMGAHCRKHSECCENFYCSSDTGLCALIP